MSGIKISLKISDTDSEMVELIGEGLKGHKLLWAVCHMDMVYENSYLKEALENGEEVQMKLVRA